MLLVFPKHNSSLIRVSSAPKIARLDNPMILIVDDEPNIADTLSMILRQEGFDCAVAYNGTDALKLARLVVPDILISDIMMPGIDGYELASLLKQLFPLCSIIFSTGNPDAAKPGYNVLEKPVPMTKLLSIIRPLKKRPVRIEGNDSARLFIC